MRASWALLATLFVTQPLSADIYEWIDSKGVKHYSTYDRPEGSRKAELAPIKRVPITTNPKLLKSCIKHGGNDCAKGADEDGSVICRDGFRESGARFIFSCSTSKLVVTEVKKNDDGKIAVYVRNEAPVKARGTFVLLRNGKLKTKIQGPMELGPHELGEFSMDPPRASVKAELTPNDFEADCVNCG